MIDLLFIAAPPGYPEFALAQWEWLKLSAGFIAAGVLYFRLYHWMRQALLS